MLNIYLIRHGETDWNILRRLQGHSDIPLNPNGIEQSRSIQSELQKINPTKIYSSDLVRAVDTAKISTEKLFHSSPVQYETEPIITTPNLREVYLGQAEGLTHDEIQQKFGIDLWAEWTQNNPRSFDMRFPEGESKTEALNRFENFIRQQCEAAIQAAGTLSAFQSSQNPNPYSSKSINNKNNNNLVFYSHGLIIRSFIHKHTPELKNPFIVKNVQIVPMTFVNSKFLLQSDAE